MPKKSRAGQVLGLLLEADQPRSGQEIGERLGCSRAAVGKAVAGLREQGFVIEARSRLGYTLVSEPDMVLPARLEARLSSQSLGLPLIHFDEIDSTNLQARKLAEGGAEHGACLVAEYQSAGRGRLERRWLAPPRTCLLFSLILRPRWGLDRVFGLTNLAAVALCRAVENLCGLKPGIKWPNDVFLEGYKLAGVLTEFTCRAEVLEFVVLGVGLNVNLSPAQLAKLPAPAASLKADLGRDVDRALLLAAFLTEISELYPEAAAGAMHRLGLEYNRRSLLIGHRVAVRDGQEVRSGIARGVAPDGALLLEEGPSRITSIRHGDVTVLSME
jgi:BirA family biotin operon repressor/biotin-[acetyl-CoA-carboxylase] ligase